MSLQGKTILVTGASRGIGSAIAEECARQGAGLVLTARTPAVQELAKRLQDAGATVEAAEGDVTDDAHVRAVLQLARSRFGGLNAVVNNAGVLTAAKLGMTKLEDVRRMFEVNVVAPLNLTQYALRMFSRGEGGSIINIASIAGTLGMEGLAAYGATKAALIGLTKIAAKELAPQKIRVNAVAPGFVDTDMARQLSPEMFQKRMDAVRMGRIGRPAEIAQCVAFLASDASCYVTGQVIGVDGGMVV